MKKDNFKIMFLTLLARSLLDILYLLFKAVHVIGIVFTHESENRGIIGSNKSWDWSKLYSLWYKLLYVRVISTPTVNSLI